MRSPQTWAYPFCNRLGQMKLDPVIVRKVKELSADVDPLVELSRDEGFRFLERLVSEWEAGINRFDAEGECLLEVRAGSQICAIGGLNHDRYPYQHARNCWALATEHKIRYSMPYCRDVPAVLAVWKSAEKGLS